MIISKKVIFFYIIIIFLSFSVCYGKTLYVHNSTSIYGNKDSMSWNEFVFYIKNPPVDSDDELNIVFSDGVFKSEKKNNRKIEIFLDGEKIKFKKISLTASGNVIFDGGMNLIGEEWTQDKKNKNIWSCAVNVNYDINAIWLDGKWANRKYPNKDIKGRNVNFNLRLLKEQGDFIWHKNILYLYAKSHPSVSFKTVEIPGSAEYCIYAKNIDKLNIRGIKFRNYYYGVKESKIFRGANIVVDNFNNVLIDNCTFSRSFANIIALSSSDKFSGNIAVCNSSFYDNYCHYYPRDGDQYNNWLVRICSKNSKIYRNKIDGLVNLYANNTGIPNSAFGIVVQQLESHPRIAKSWVYNNTISGMGRTGIGLFDSTKDGVDFDADIKISNNHIYDGLKGYSRMYKKSIDCDGIGIGGSTKHKKMSWKNVVINNNVIENFGHTGIHLANKQGKNFFIFNNVIIGCPAEKNGFSAIRANNGCNIYENLIIQSNFGYGIAEANAAEKNNIVNNTIITNDKNKYAPFLIINGADLNNDAMKYNKATGHKKEMGGKELIEHKSSKERCMKIYTDVTGKSIKI